MQYALHGGGLDGEGCTALSYGNTHTHFTSVLLTRVGIVQCPRYITSEDNSRSIPKSCALK